MHRAKGDKLVRARVLPVCDNIPFVICVTEVELYERGEPIYCFAAITPVIVLT